MKTRTAAFHAYRYQILPTSQEIQLTLDGGIRGVEDLKRHKNTFFAEALAGIKVFTYGRAEIVHQTVATSGTLTIFRLAVERDLRRQRKDFVEEPVENWPDTWIVFDNNPTVQKCLIQKRGGFQRTKTVAKILEDTINARLIQHQLSAVFEPIYSKNVFWDLTRRYQGRITQIEFELVSPNMSNISASLKIDLAGLNKSTNTQRTKFQLNSDPRSALTPNEDDETISGLVDYASQGGGDITVRARGVKHKVHTAKGITELSIDELELQGKPDNDIVRIFRKLVRG